MTEHEHSLPSPALVQHHLHGMHYPATRDDLINYARSQCEGGDHSDSECERVVQTLSQLPDREYQRPTDVRKAFGELARNYLERVSYPAGRDDLVASVREQGADDVVLDTIIMIPSQEYRNPDAVIVEIEASVLGATLAWNESPSARPRPASCVQYRGHAPGLCRCDQFLVIAGDLIGIGGGEHGNRVVELVSPA